MSLPSSACSYSITMTIMLLQWQLLYYNESNNDSYSIVMTYPIKMTLLYNSDTYSVTMTNHYNNDSYSVTMAVTVTMTVNLLQWQSL